MKRKIIFCLPVYPKRPHQATLDALRDSVPAIEAEGWEHGAVHEVGNPYISAARATMLRKALDAKADDVIFIDADVSWRPEDMIKLLKTDGDVVVGTYRFKNGDADDITGRGAPKDGDWYMGGYLPDALGRPQVREDGAIKMEGAPAGFLRITRAAVNLLMEKYPELCYGERHAQHFDLFNHGAHKGLWFGEDMAFCRRWRDIGETIWCQPDMNIDHHGAEGRHGEDAQVWRGNYHRYLLAQPGGSDSDCPVDPREILAKALAKARKTC